MDDVLLELGAGLEDVEFIKPVLLELGVGCDFADFGQLVLGVEVALELSRQGEVEGLSGHSKILS